MDTLSLLKTLSVAPGNVQQVTSLSYTFTDSMEGLLVIGHSGEYDIGYPTVTISNGNATLLSRMGVQSDSIGHSISLFHYKAINSSVLSIIFPDEGRPGGSCMIFKK